MGRQIDALARFVAQTVPGDIPEDVRAHARLVLLDTLGVVLAGSVRPEVAALRVRLGVGAGTGATVLAPGLPAHDPRSAALLNGIAGRAIELCEGLRLVSGQAAMQVLPGVLAVGEQCGTSGRELLAAFVLGYDAAGRLCSAFTPRPLAHQNGQASLVAAAAAGARARGLDAAGTGLAMRAAASLVLTPSYTNTVAGATSLNVAGGMSGFVGALAPELAAAGFVAKDDAVEEAFSQLVGDGFAAESVAEDLGVRWHITRNYFRMHACCNPIHPALDCLQAVLGRLRPAAEDIERIEMATYRFASVMRETGPSNYFASKYSFPHVAAVMAVRGAAGYREVDDSALADARIAALRERVHVSEDPAMTAVAPRLRPARVTVRLRDGRSDTQALDSHKGDFADPYDAADIRAKFRDLAGEVLRPEGVARVEAAVDACESWSSVHVLIDALRAGARA